MKERLGWRIMLGISNMTITNGLYPAEHAAESDGGDGTLRPDIEVFIPELAPNAVGEPVDPKNPQNTKAETTNPLTKEKGASTIPRVHTINCQYMGGQNFLVPCVTKGEQVWVLQYEGGELAYYWLPIGRDEGLRLREHIRWYAMNQPSSVTGDNVWAAVDDKNSYFVDINTNQDAKMIHIHTAVNDGEQVGYDIRINPKDQILEIVDTKEVDGNGIGIGNYIRLDSANTIWKIRNIDESFIELNKTDITISCLNNLTINVGNIMTTVVGNNQTTTVTNNIATTAVKGTMSDTAGINIVRTAGAAITDTAPAYTNASAVAAFKGTSFVLNDSIIAFTSTATIDLAAPRIGLTGAAQIMLAGALTNVFTAHGNINLLVW